MSKQSTKKEQIGDQYLPGKICTLKSNLINLIKYLLKSDMYFHYVPLIVLGTFYQGFLQKDIQFNGNTSIFTKFLYPIQNQINLQLIIRLKPPCLTAYSQKNQYFWFLIYYNQLIYFIRKIIQVEIF